MDSSRLRKDIVKEIVAETAFDTKTVEAIISHQFASARDAMDKYNSIEISGWGRFVICTSYLEKRIGIQENHIVNMEKRRDELNSQGKINYYQNIIDDHKNLLRKMRMKFENYKREKGND
jgi:nucleoid DNA-binding protein